MTTLSSLPRIPAATLSRQPLPQFAGGGQAAAAVIGIAMLVGGGFGLAHRTADQKAGDEFVQSVSTLSPDNAQANASLTISVDELQHRMLTRQAGEQPSYQPNAQQATQLLSQAVAKGGITQPQLTQYVHEAKFVNSEESAKTFYDGILHDLEASNALDAQQKQTLQTASKTFFERWDNANGFHSINENCGYLLLMMIGSLLAFGSTLGLEDVPFFVDLAARLRHFPMPRP